MNASWYLPPFNTRGALRVGGFLVLSLLFAASAASAEKFTGDKENFRKKSKTPLELVAQAKPRVLPDPRRRSSGLTPVVDNPGWTKLNLNSFFDVTPKNLPASLRGVEGSSGVLRDWNGAAWDPAARCMYFHGGGHAGYFGNEVYRFCLASRKWERLSDPSRIVVYERAVAEHLFTPENGYSSPPKPQPGKEFLIPFGPASTHTYDGVWIHDGKFWVVASSVFQEGVRNYAGIHLGLFAFDPVRRTWEKISPFVTDSGKSFQPVYPASAMMPNGRMKISASRMEVEFDFADRKFKNLRAHSMAGSGQGSMIVVGDVAYSVSYARNLMIYDAKNTVGASRHIPLPDGGSVAAGLAYRRGAVYIKPSSGGEVHRFDIASGSFFTHPAAVGKPAPGFMRPFSQWNYDEGTDAFYTGDWSGNFWRWRVTGTAVKAVFRSPLSKEQAITANSRNGIASIPKAIYGGSGLVKKSVDADWNHSDLKDATQGKGTLVIRPTGGPVTMRNFTVRGGQGAVRDESGVILSLVGAEAYDTVEGLLLSGNGGTGVYNIVDCIAARGAADTSRTRGSMHNIYIGVSRSATFVNFRSLGHVYYGHLLKSRSTDLTLLGSRLDGLDTTHSRAIDWNPQSPGTLSIKNTTIVQSARAENADFIGIAREQPSYQRVKNLKVVIRKSRFVCKRRSPCYFSVGPGVKVTFDIDNATRAASRNIRWP